MSFRLLPPSLFLRSNCSWFPPLLMKRGASGGRRAIDLSPVAAEARPWARTLGDRPARELMEIPPLVERSIIGVVAQFRQEHEPPAHMHGDRPLTRRAVQGFRQKLNEGSALDLALVAPHDPIAQSHGALGRHKARTPGVEGFPVSRAVERDVCAPVALAQVVAVGGDHKQVVYQQIASRHIPSGCYRRGGSP